MEVIGENGIINKMEIQEKWEYLTIESVCIKKGIVRGPFGGALKKSDFTKSGIKVYEQKNAIYKDVNLGSYFIDYKKYNELSRFEVFEGDFIISCSGTIGKIFIIPSRFPKGIINQALLKLTTNDRVIDKSFFYYYFEWDKFQEIIIDNTQGGAMKNLVGMPIFRVTPITLPPLPEQQAIAEVLSDTDNLIQALEKQIAKKRLIKQGVMQELLTPKEGWEKKRLGDIVEILDHLRKPLNESNRQKMTGDIPYCGANGIVDFVDRYVINDSIILIAEDGGYFDEYLTRPIAYQMKGKCWVNNHAHILKSKNDYDQDFIFYSLVHKNILDFINGGTRAKLNKGELINITINTSPSKSEQSKIAIIITNISEEINVLEDKLKKYKNLKQGLMQQLLTGKIRLIKHHEKVH